MKRGSNATISILLMNFIDYEKTVARKGNRSINSTSVTNSHFNDDGYHQNSFASENLIFLFTKEVIEAFFFAGSAAAVCAILSTCPLPVPFPKLPAFSSLYRRHAYDDNTFLHFHFMTSILRLTIKCENVRKKKFPFTSYDDCVGAVAVLVCSGFRLVWAYGSE